MEIACMPPFYDPPYDSPLEDLFAWHIVKYLGSGVQFDKQVEAQTNCGTFRIDFVAVAGSLRIGFECDGQEFHGRFGSWRDEWRDAAILALGSVQAIYRFRGKDLTYHMEDCLSVAAKCDPGLFSDRGIGNLELLTSESARHVLERQDLNTPPYSTFIGYPEMRYEYGILVERRTINSPYFRTWLDYITAHGGGDLDTLMQAWLEERKQQTIQGGE